MSPKIQVLEMDKKLSILGEHIALDYNINRLVACEKHMTRGFRNKMGLEYLVVLALNESGNSSEDVLCKILLLYKSNQSKNAFFFSSFIVGWSSKIYFYGYK
jgi:hypothetical protein